MTTIDTVIGGVIDLMRQDTELQALDLTVYDGDEEEVKGETLRVNYPAAVVVYAGTQDASTGAMGRGQGEVRRPCEIQVYLFCKEYRGRGRGRTGIYALVERTIRLLTGREFGDDTGRVIFQGDMPFASDDRLVVGFLLRFAVSIDTFIS